jgi:hypothetical protein
MRRSLNKGSSLLGERIMDNKKIERIIEDYISDIPFVLDPNWLLLKDEEKQLSYVKWTATLILGIVRDARNSPAESLIEEFLSMMDAYYNVSRSKKTDLVWRTASETAEEILREIYEHGG